MAICSKAKRPNDETDTDTTSSKSRHVLMHAVKASNAVDVMIHSFIKKKAIPLQAWTGPEGSRSLRLLDFKTIDT